VLGADDVIGESWQIFTPIHDEDDYCYHRKRSWFQQSITSEIFIQCCASYLCLDYCYYVFCGFVFSAISWNERSDAPVVPHCKSVLANWCVLLSLGGFWKNSAPAIFIAGFFGVKVFQITEGNSHLQNYVVLPS
jgi:hypothetical protein